VRPSAVDVRPGLTGNRWLLDRTVYRSGQRAGHYESFYQRANHPDRPLAFWLRYTIFAPARNPSAAVGELWAVAFDGESGQHAVAKEEFPLAQCRFPTDRFDVRVGDAGVAPGRLTGAAGELRWDLRYEGEAPPLLLLPAGLYRGGFPKAKSLVPLPLARYSGSYSVAGRTIEVDGWLGSQNHNWGSRHTDRYAFGQVAGFDGFPGTFLEVATAKTALLRPLTTPWATTLVLRHRGAEHSIVSLRRAVRAKARYGYFDWEFATGDAAVEISGRISAARDAFVGLRYRNPPGGMKFCLNTKIAAAEISVRDRATGRTERLRSSHRALFELLTSDSDSGIELRA
jgi:hypothetical protein